MKRRRAAVEDLLNERGDGGTGGPVLGEGVDLLLSGNLTSEEKPEETLGKRLRPARGLRESLLDLGDGLAAETDTLLCGENVSKGPAELGGYGRREEPR